MNNDWLSEVADNLDISRAEVVSVAQKYQIKASPISPTPKNISLKRICFAGKNTSEQNPGKIDFDWSGLDSGLFGIMSERNLRGKSTIIGVVQWLLRGRNSSLQDDVISWINNASMRFSISDTTYEVAVNCNEETTGSLVKINDHGEVHPLANFYSGAEFEETMSNFMMDELSLEPVVVWRGKAPIDGGKRVTHEWPSLAGAMFIGTDYKTLFGDVSADGLSIRLMQMYLGLPWISTLTSAKASEKRLTKESEANARQQKAECENKETRIQELKAEIKVIKSKLISTPSDNEIRAERDAAGEQLKNVYVLIRNIERELSLCTGLKEQARAIYLNDKKELQSFVDAHAAGAVFRRLSPSICPRCESEIPPAKLDKEQETGDCCICNEHILDDGSADEIHAGIVARVEASEEAAKEASEKLNDLNKGANKLYKDRDMLVAKCQELETQLDSYTSRRDLEFQLGKAEAQLEEVSRTSISNSHDKGNDLKVVSKLVKDVEKRVKTIQSGVLKEVSDKILSYGQMFGIENLTQVELKGNGHLNLVKGGSHTVYGKLTLGEQLRMKVATILAVVGVSYGSGIGRHPGLLMIDSPGAQEIVSTDLEKLMSGLVGVMDELPFLQIFVASVASDAVTRHIEGKKCVAAHGDNYLW